MQPSALQHPSVDAASCLHAHGAVMPQACCCLASLVPLVPQKKSQENINSRLALVMKSGKFTLGTKTSIKCMRSGKGETQT